MEKTASITTLIKKITSLPKLSSLFALSSFLREIIGISLVIFLISCPIFPLLSQEQKYPPSSPETARVYLFGLLSFSVKYEIYCTKEPMGYFKYPGIVLNETYFFTYEGEEFYRQSQFDTDFYVYRAPFPANLWTNSRGELLLFKKAFSPVTDQDKKALNFPYGYARNWK